MPAAGSVKHFPIHPTTAHGGGEGRGGGRNRDRLGTAGGSQPMLVDQEEDAKST